MTMIIVTLLVKQNNFKCIYVRTRGDAGLLYDFFTAALSINKKFRAGSDKELCFIQLIYFYLFPFCGQCAGTKSD